MPRQSRRAPARAEGPSAGVLARAAAALRAGGALLADTGLRVGWRDASSDSEVSDWLWILATRS